MGHIKDISLRAERSGRYFFTSFLTPAQQSYIESMKRELCSFKFYGGAELTERNMARFGDENEIGWEQDFPITVFKVSPLNAKFSDSLTHRDFLGALMNLGIERDQIGDIAVKDNEAYIFVTDKDGKKVEYGETKMVLEHPQDPYTRELLAAVPKLQRKVKK